MVLTRDLHELVTRQSELAPVRTKILVDKVIAKGIVSRGNRGMRREERICRDCFAGLVKAKPGSNEFPAPFQVQEGGVPLVQAPGRRRNAQGTYSAHRSNAPHTLLRD